MNSNSNEVKTQSNSKKLSKNEKVKFQTLALYDQLSQDEEERKSRIDIRDKIIELNYSFFGYVASHTFINNSSVTYEDKFQSALMHFCECWWWYKWEQRYRTDLSFGSFFKPRIGEMIERELNEVKYSLRRSLCMEVGKQLGKHWGQVKYEDLSDPRLHLPVDKMNSLKAMFGAVYWADLSETELYIPAPKINLTDESSYVTDKYNSITELLIQEMIERESQLTDSQLLEMSELYCIPYDHLKQLLPIALSALHKRLTDNLDNLDI